LIDYGAALDATLAYRASALEALKLADGYADMTEEAKAAWDAETDADIDAGMAIENTDRLASGYDDMSFAEKIAYEGEWVGIMEYVLAACTRNENTMWCLQAGKMLGA